MQKNNDQWKRPQEKLKSTIRMKTSKDDAQKKSSTSSSVQLIQRRCNSNCTMKKEPSGQKILTRDEQLIHYQTIPGRRFSNERAHEIIKQIVDERLENVEYSSTCSSITKELSDCIRTAVKKLLCDRYKLVCFVAIGQLKDSVVNFSSRAMWSPTADTFTEYVFKNRSLFAVCILFAVYKE